MTPKQTPMEAVEKKWKYAIKFSNEYTKFPMPTPFTARLLQVIKVNYSDLSPHIIEYDTFWIDGDEMGHYELPKTNLIMLFLHCEKGLFITMRRYTPDKWKFYKSLVGYEVGIVRGDI